MNMRDDDRVSARSRSWSSPRRDRGGVTDADLAAGPVELSAGAARATAARRRDPATARRRRRVRTPRPAEDDDGARAGRRRRRPDARPAERPDGPTAATGASGARRRSTGPTRFGTSRGCYFADHQRKEVVRISSSSSCGTLEVAGR